MTKRKATLGDIIAATRTPMGAPQKVPRLFGELPDDVRAELEAEMIADRLSDSHMQRVCNAVFEKYEVTDNDRPVDLALKTVQDHRKRLRRG